MAVMPTHDVQRTPPAAASPGLPPVDPVVTARREQAAPIRQPSYPEVPQALSEAAQATATGDTKPPQPGLSMRQGVAFEAGPDPLANRLDPCAGPSSPAADNSGQGGLEEGLPFRNSDSDQRDDEPIFPLINTTYEHSTSEGIKDEAADPSRGEPSLHISDIEMAASSDAPQILAVDSRSGDRLPRASKPAGPAARVPPRVADRPRMEDWADDELLTLPEAAALFWPDGPITTNTLRTAGRQGTLAITKVAGKFFTTPMAVRRMGTDEAGDPLGREAAVPERASPRALFEAKLEEARRQGRDRKRRQRAAKRSVAPQEGAGR